MQTYCLGHQSCSLFPVAVRKYPDTNNLKGERVYSGPGLTGQPIGAGKLRAAAGHITPPIRKQRAMGTHC